MKLSPPKITDSMLQWALWWSGLGWSVFPVYEPAAIDVCSCIAGTGCRDAGKHPRIKDGFKGGTIDPEQVRAWWAQWPNASIGATPPQDWLVVDIDGPSDVQFPSTRTHTTAKGRHLFFLQNPDFPLPQRSKPNQIWPNVDTRVSGKGYVLLPPSVHVSGKRYSIVDAHDPVVFPLELIPDEIRNPSFGAGGGRKRPGHASAREIIRLLSLPRDSEDLGDDAMMRVGAWLARYMPDKESYGALMDVVNQSLADPLSDAAMGKKFWVWDKHHSDIAQAIEEAPGWLKEVNDVYYSAVGVADKLETVPVSNFRIEVRGLIKFDEEQLWIVDLHKSDGTVQKGLRLSSNVTASSSALKRWLHGHGCAFLPHTADRRGDLGSRLLMSLLAQDYTELVATDHYGWHPEVSAFVVPGGQITEHGFVEATKVYPDDSLRVQFPANYGMCSRTEALNVLREVLTFQDETATAVMGSWLMMLILRGQWQGLMPALSVIAHSESGKTTYLRMLCQLAGSPQKGGRMTVPTVRDAFRGNMNGVVWLDDIKIRDDLQELLRVAITGGDYTLKGVGTNVETKRVPLRSALIVSGEAVDFARQKANRDRFIDVDFPNPTGRRSQYDPQKSQWVDIQSLLARYEGDLSAVAGGLVQAVLPLANRLGRLSELLEHSTRAGQSQAVILMGAEILSELLDDPSYLERVQDWASARDVSANAASVGILQIIPTIWRSHGQPVSFLHHPPVFRDPDTQLFHVHVTTTSEEWARSYARGERDRELSSEEALARELSACGATKGTQHKWEGRRIRYREIPLQYSKMIYERVTGSLEDDDEEGESLTEV